jgi:hypothetical protein
MATGGLLAASATRTAGGGAEAPRAWAPKDTDWTQFRHDAAHRGVTEANATMRFAYCKWSVNTGSAVYSSPAVADIDNDGRAEVVFGCNDGRLYAVDYNF